MNDSHILISVVIPVFNDPPGLAATLDSIVDQDYPAYEVIPVDNNSTDDTPSVIQSWARRHPSLLRPAEERTIQSSYAARNTGITQAAGDVLVFIDADMTVPDGWLHDIASTFRDTQADYLGYDIEMYIPEGEEGRWGWYDKMMGLPVRRYYEQNQFVPTSCLAVRSSIFDAVGPFDSRLLSSGDREFGRRVHAHPDLQTTFSDDIVVFHPARTTFREHYQKALRVGRGLVQVQTRGPNSERMDVAFANLADHLLPPNPLRIYNRVPPLPPSEYALLYAMDWLVRGIRLYGGLLEYTETRMEASAP